MQRTNVKEAKPEVCSRVIRIGNSGKAYRNSYLLNIKKEKENLFIIQELIFAEGTKRVGS